MSRTCRLGLSTCQKEKPLVVHLFHNLPQLRLLAFQSMSFVHDQDLKCWPDAIFRMEFLEDDFVAKQAIIRCQHHIKLHLQGDKDLVRCLVWGHQNSLQDPE